jgi:hypothetical protein
VTSSIENPIPTQRFLLPGQESCVGLPWERAELPKHGLPPAPKSTFGSVLDPTPDLEGDPREGSMGRCEVIRQLSAGRLLAFRGDLVEGADVVVLRQLDVDGGEGPTIEAYSAEAMRLRHPNLARVHDCEVSDEGIFWVTAYVAGATLSEITTACRIQGKAVPLGLVLPAVYEAALALSEVHQRTTHGLMSNQAIAVNFDGVTQLLDVGLFQVLARKRSWAQLLVMTGPYLAPEQVFAGRLPDPKADLYSLGIVLYECLTGDSLRRTAQFEDRVKLMAREVLPPPSTRNVMVGKGIDEVVMRVLSTDRSRRYPSALEFANDLKRASSSFMWRHAVRATFVAELFETRRRRDKALMAEVLPLRNRATIAKHLASAPLEPLATPSDRVMPIRVPAQSALPLKKKAQAKQSSFKLGHLLAALAGCAAGLLVALMSRQPLANDASGTMIPRGPVDSVPERVAQPVPIETVMTFEGARPLEPLVSTGVFPVEREVKKAQVKGVRQPNDEPPIPSWLRRGR